METYRHLCAFHESHPLNIYHRQNLLNRTIATLFFMSNTLFMKVLKLEKNSTRTVTQFAHVLICTCNYQSGLPNTSKLMRSLMLDNNYLKRPPRMVKHHF
jgi:hypothetical protein